MSEYPVGLCVGGDRKKFLSMISSLMAVGLCVGGYQNPEYAFFTDGG